jgi:predicted DNA-binding transcriptional regulator AlpA
MIVVLRFRDLVDRGLVKSWAQLKRLQTKDGFPLGRMLSSNTRTWTEEEVDEWYASRPVAGPELRGAAKIRRARKDQSQTAVPHARASASEPSNNP